MTFHSFAAEVDFHADCTLLTAGFYNEGYEKACRADMTTIESWLNGFVDDYHDVTSELVQRQGCLHPDYPFQIEVA